MKKKMIGIFVCMLVIAITIPSIGAITLPTTSLIKDHHSSERYQTTTHAIGAINFPMTFLTKDHLFSERYQTTPPASPGNLINIRIRAEVVDITDDSNLLEGKIKIGDKITGKYTYDADTPISYPYPNIGYYIMNDTSCGFDIKVSGLTFKTDPDNALTIVVVANDFEYQDDIIDAIEVLSIVASPISQELICIVDLLLWDSTATAISSIALPTKAPVLRNWEDKTLSIFGFDPYSYNIFVITANVTLAFKPYGADLQGATSVVRQSLTTIPNIINIPFSRFWVNVFERSPNAFPTLRRLMGY